MIQLTPMTQPEYETFLAYLIPDYAADMVHAGFWRAEEAQAKAEHELAENLPRGLETPDSYLYTLIEAETGQKVGVLWCLFRQISVPEIFIADIMIYKEFRRRGYARQALEALHQRAKEMGAVQVGLHVFGYNQAARTLYEQMGYTATSLQMRKALG